MAIEKVLRYADREDPRKISDTSTLACEGLIRNPLDHLIAMHRQSDSESVVHIEVVADSGKRTHRKYMVADLPQLDLDDLCGVSNVFTAINAMSDPNRNRSNANVASISWLWSDLDRPEGASPDWILMTSIKIEKMVKGGLIPEPTMVCSSGRGLWTFWAIRAIDPMKDADSYERWRRCMRQFGDVLRPLGSDSKATDAARLMRLAGSRNPHNGQTVSLTQYSARTYDLSDLADRFVPVIRKPPRTKPTRTKNESKGKPKEASGSVSALPRNLRHVNMYRCEDLQTLVGLREGKVTGYRNMILFLFALHAMYYHGSERVMSYRVGEVASLFVEPLDSGEITAIIRSAADSYDEQGQHKYRYKTETILKMLDITAAEMEFMSTLFGDQQKRERRIKRRAAARRAAGVPTRVEMAEEREQIKRTQEETLRTLIAQNPTMSNRGLARLMEVSEGTVRNIRKRL